MANIHMMQYHCFRPDGKFCCLKIQQREAPSVPMELKDTAQHPVQDTTDAMKVSRKKQEALPSSTSYW